MIRKVPKSVYPEKNSRIKASMIDNLTLTHFHSLGHPVEESEVSPEIEIHKLAHKISTSPGAASSSTDIPFWKVNSVVDGLDSKQSKSQQESKST